MVAAGVVLSYVIRRSYDVASALPPDHPGLRMPQAGGPDYGSMGSIMPSGSRPIGMPAAPSAAAAAAEGPVVPGAGSV